MQKLKKDASLREASGNSDFESLSLSLFLFLKVRIHVGRYSRRGGAERKREREREEGALKAVAGTNRMGELLKRGRRGCTVIDCMHEKINHECRMKVLRVSYRFRENRL